MGMKEAILVCSDWECHTNIGNAVCPDCNTILDYVHGKTAHCPKCGEDWHPVNLNKRCPRCNSSDLNFEPS